VWGVVNTIIIQGSDVHLCSCYKTIVSPEHCGKNVNQLEYVSRTLDIIV
jgi:hypothetical protein